MKLEFWCAQTHPLGIQTFAHQPPKSHNKQIQSLYFFERLGQRVLLGLTNGNKFMQLQFTD